MCSPSHPISVFICAICGRFPLLLEIYSPTDSTDFHRFLYPRIRVHPRYLWKTSPHPISVFICAICGRFLRTLTSVGDFLCCLRFDSPTDSTDTHRFYISQYPCSSVLSVGDSLCCLRFILPRIPQISQILYIPVSVFICAICGKHLRTQYPCSSVLSVGESFAP